MSSKNFLGKVDRIRSYFKDWKIDGCVIENRLDLFYFTGMQLSTGLLLIQQKEITLFIDGRYLEWSKKHSPFPVQLYSQLPKLQETIGFDSQKTTVRRAEQLKKTFELRPIPYLTKNLRCIKDLSEIKKMEKSAALLWRGFDYIRRKLKVGIKEKELALDFEIFCRKLGAQALSFEPIIAFGKNSAYPHYRAGNTPLKKGDIVLFDLGVVLDHYHSDMTRTLFFGKPDSRLVLLESVVKKAHASALESCFPGTRVGDLDEAAQQVIKHAGLENLLQHSLGHGIGLETHEFPRVKFQGEDQDALLQPGMVITIEPGLYLPGVGGVRYEDTIVITEQGYKNFYVSKD